MKAIENWVKDIVFYMIFVTMVMNLLPDPKYEKYLPERARCLGLGAAAAVCRGGYDPAGFWAACTDHGDGDSDSGHV